MIYTALYVGSVVFVNLIFGTLPFPWNVVVGSAIVGGILICRDFMQIELEAAVGRYRGWIGAVAATVGGIALSWALGAPAVALASACAFAASEFSDAVVFTVTRKPMRDRILLSGLVAAPIDTIVFLSMRDSLTWSFFALQVVSKIAALAVVVLWPRPTLETA